MSASSWGCELKCQWYWQQAQKSCQPPREAVSWNVFNESSGIQTAVSLLVRLWVEIFYLSELVSRYSVSLLVRLWVEIVLVSAHIGARTGQPPREAVSWNYSICAYKYSYMSASSWGCELKYITEYCTCKFFSQPPREAVSWNNFRYHNRLYVRQSASSWGCELKFQEYRRVTYSH